jgi:hypothetical protein
MKYSLLLSALIFTLAGYGQAWTKQYDHVDDCIWVKSTVLLIKTENWSFP